jgi:hypothetical protein
MRASIILAAGGLALPGLTPAQESAGQFELTAYAGFRVGGELEEQDHNRDFALDERSAQGLIFNFPAGERDGQWEVSFSRQRTAVETQTDLAGGPRLGLDVDYLHFGGTYLFRRAPVRPFVAASVGAAHFDPGLPGFAAQTYFSGSLGGGVQLRTDKRVGLRLEGRLFGSLLDEDGELFCPSRRNADTCALLIEGTMLMQWEARLGLVFRF